MLTGCQKDRNIEGQSDKTDVLTERQIQDRKTFQLSYQNKSCQECKQETGCQKNSPGSCTDS